LVSKTNLDKNFKPRDTIPRIFNSFILWPRADIFVLYARANKQPIKNIMGAEAEAEEGGAAEEGGGGVIA
jgi:hypothetical protein